VWPNIAKRVAIVLYADVGRTRVKTCRSLTCHFVACLVSHDHAGGCSFSLITHS
jgi:hypothetical protein